MQNEHCPLCFGGLEVREVAPCEECGGDPQEIDHFRQGKHTYQRFETIGRMNGLSVDMTSRYAISPPRTARRCATVARCSSQPCPAMHSGSATSTDNDGEDHDGFAATTRTTFNPRRLRGHEGHDVTQDGLAVTTDVVHHEGSAVTTDNDDEDHDGFAALCESTRIVPTVFCSTTIWSSMIESIRCQGISTPR